MILYKQKWKLEILKYLFFIIITNFHLNKNTIRFIWCMEFYIHIFKSNTPQYILNFEQIKLRNYLNIEKVK